MLVTPFGKPLNRRFSIPGQALGSGFFYVLFFLPCFYFGFGSFVDGHLQLIST